MSAPCECWYTPESQWTTHYGAVEPGSQMEFNPRCPEHGRLGSRGDPNPKPIVPARGCPCCNGQTDFNWFNDACDGCASAIVSGSWDEGHPHELSPKQAAAIDEARHETNGQTADDDAAADGWPR